MRSDPRLADLPATLLLLPLDSLVLLPETALPITLTDPASRAIVDAALAAGGYAGVLQPLAGDGAQFYSVGCLGHIVDLGRDAEGHHVLLEGLVRFRIRQELPPQADGLSRAAVAYDEFRHDLEAAETPAGWDLDAFKAEIVEFGRKQFGSAGVLADMPPRQVILFMAQTAPFTGAEKQALLEAPGLRELVDTLARLLSLNFLTTTPDTSPPTQVN
jgi:Lon protease-like protein